MDWPGLDPALVWGLIPRFVGVLYVIAFGALSSQILSIIGTDGAAPLAPRLQRIRRDYPGWRGFLEMPTVFWLNASDTAIRTVPLVGMVAGALAIYGGDVGYVGLVVGWMLWLSVEPAGLIFPWDTMLQEAGFFALFLPLARTLPDLRASALPLPSVAFMFRWFVLRLMLGFAKVKFIGTGKSDALYLRGFLIWAPMPTPLAWWGHHLPRWFLKASLGFMFVGEAIAPVLGFFTGMPRLLSFAIMSALMIGIQLTGNWGYFNIGFVMLSVCLLDLNASVFDLGQDPWASSALTWPAIGIHVAMALLFFTSLPQFLVMNSWVSRTWVHWHWELFTRKSWIGRVLMAWFRAVAPFHMVNGYGVFPPFASPPIRYAPVFEGSDDGKTWKAYGFKYLPSTPESHLPLVAPHHPRFDQALHYACIGMHDAGFFSALISDGSPYLGYLRTSWLDRAAQHLLRNSKTLLRNMGSNPFPDAPPKLVRVSTYVLAPVTPAERRRTGKLWRMRRLGTLIPARGPEAWVEGLALPEPEQFHPEFVHHKRRAAPLCAMVEAFAQGAPPHEAVRVASDLTAADVTRFWTDFIPAMQEGRDDWARLHERAGALRARFTPEEIYDFERLLLRYAWLLRQRTEPFVEGVGDPVREFVDLFRYEMILQEIVTDGPAALAAMYSDPATIVERIERSTDAAQLWTLGMLRYDMLMFHVRTFRWNDIGTTGYRYKLPGIFQYFPLLSKTVPPEEELRPLITKHDDGEFTVDSLYPSALVDERSHA